MRDEPPHPSGALRLMHERLRRLRLPTLRRREMPRAPVHAFGGQMRAALSTSCALVVALTTGWTMSCAGTEERALDEQDASMIAPGADAAEAGCDGCGPTAPSCDEVDFCPAPLALAPTFAL